MKHLTKFENHTLYEEASQNLILPNVSLCAQENEVHYNPYVPPIIDGHEYVDLGLPSGTKWATMNVGAINETDYGNYYMYGMGSKTYDRTDTRYAGTEDPLATSADTVAQEWGGDWHMPTKAQMEELKDNTTHQLVTDYKGSGINGCLFTAQNGNSVFFPAAGFLNYGMEYNVGSGCCYWSSSPKGKVNAYQLLFAYGEMLVNGNTRTDGFSVRGVVG